MGALCCVSKCSYGYSRPLCIDVFLLFFKASLKTQIKKNMLGTTILCGVGISLMVKTVAEPGKAQDKFIADLPSFARLSYFDHIWQ